MQNGFWRLDAVRNMLVMGAVLLGLGAASTLVYGSSQYEKVDRQYVTAAHAPATQSDNDVELKSAGCVSCHTDSDAKNMHVSESVKLGCVDCHGGNPEVTFSGVQGANLSNLTYKSTMQKAHVLPRYPDAWPTSRNPERTYTLLNKESPEFVRFINPSDLRVANESCGACHQEIVEASTRSLHSTTAMFWSAASYNNGILPYKDPIMGESYNRDGVGTVLKGPKIPEDLKDEAAAMGIVPQLLPLAAWETVKPGDIFRVFEDGGRNIGTLFPETGLPNAAGLIQRLEEPGRPDFKQSNRGPGTGQRIAVPLLNITKTRLNDPLTWFIGTNDQPGDYRHSGCASCHVVYANDREVAHSGPYAQFGHDGKTATKDPTINKAESGHPLEHKFTRAVPSSQCMSCHMHQPNMFMNTFLGYTMWDYESDAPFMWPEKQQYPTAEERRKVLERNPEGAAPRGKWADLDFLKKVWENNDQYQDTQFADYHGHGWNFRAVFKRDRKGHLLDENGEIVTNDDPEKFKKAVHLTSTHLDAGMHCADCHFSQDNHGNGYLYGEVAMAVEVGCKDCHGTAQELPNLFTSGPAALEGGTDMSLMRTPDGRRRFEWINNDLYQRSIMYPDKEWKVSLVKKSVSKSSADYNEKAARAKLMSNDVTVQHFGVDVPMEDLAHSNDKMECFACHTSWTNTCGGCHLPIKANEKTERHHYEGGETRNFASYNPQVAGDQMFLLGKHSPGKGGKYAPVRSSSALVLSSENANREKIYIQQPPIAASGFSSQAFNPHFPHTTRKTETKTCSNCHLAEANDNNAIMSQLLVMGTNSINFIGYYAWLGTESNVTGVEVTEWDEPQAVIGSYLHRYAYPDWFKDHQDNNERLKTAYTRSSGKAQCVQMRGEYLYVAEGKSGFRVYDIASIANKGVSQRIITAPASPLGHDTQISSANASCVALPSNQPIRPSLNTGELMRKTNQEQPFAPIYNYALITDTEEGLILVDIDTLMDGEPTNNQLKRALTWNENDVLKGAKHLTIGGNYVYVAADVGMVILDLNDPLKPTVAAVVPMQDVRASALQFRYLFVTNAEGLQVIDVTHPDKPKLVSEARLAIKDAQKLYLSRTYAYIAAGKEGLLIVDIESPEEPKLHVQYDADGRLGDSRDVVVGATNASLFAYVADGKNGLQIVQLTSPELQPNFYGFSPEPVPKFIASYPTASPALSLSRGLDRDRGVDETGGQIAVFGRKGSRPLNKEEMEKLYLDENGEPWFVKD
ncbi:multiheme c-type cytochrome [Marinobacter salexigens]|uniref:Cytochrome c-552/4 domain-containing protein n=1 Tax=Marinobacter salexigens TaxID=1925763 RepID=A0ABS6ABN1_9GAMM|nr:hypothetical protein [Marinobacter salexigens]MBU2874219.1 hypothetical protein [Marinobacter salexigens]